jgi:hypothetical protein
MQAQPIIDALPDSWKGWAMLAAAALFVFGLLFERLWFLAELRRDVNEIKSEIPRMKGDIKTAQGAADETRKRADAAVAELARNNELLDRLNESVLNLPTILVQMMTGRPPGGPATR